MKRFIITASLILGLGLTLALPWWLTISGTGLPVVHAAELQVCPSGCAYSSVQAAVDAANTGDEIKVAAGTYTGVSARAGVTQVVYINKTVTIQSGYTTTNWTMPYPITQPTTLDAQGQGRVLYIIGNISPTIEGLRITGGNATGLGGVPYNSSYNAGGGIYVITAAAAIRNNWLFGNTAGFSGIPYLEFMGGGLYVYSSGLFEK